MQRPNILFIMADQLRWDALGCTGGWVRTPFIDGIAASGVSFANCVTNSPACVPARVSMATGLYPHNNGVWHNVPYNTPAEAHTWIRELRDAGYRTSVFGKTHLHAHAGDLRRRAGVLRRCGLDDIDEIAGPRASMNVGSNLTDAWSAAGVWEAYCDDLRERYSTRPWLVRPSVLPLELYADCYVGARACEYLQRYDAGQPWFCWVSFGGPHEPWDAPEPYASMYAPEAMPLPRAPSSEASGSTRARGYADKLLRRRHAFADGDVAAMRANYAGGVSLIDDQIGAVLDVVRARGELDRTIIVFSSDHGEMNGDHGLIHKSNFYDGAVRIPLIVSAP